MERCNDFVERDILLRIDEKEDLNATMIRDTFEVTFHLFRCLRFCHSKSITQKHTHNLKYVSMFCEREIKTIRWGFTRRESWATLTLVNSETDNQSKAAGAPSFSIEEVAKQYMRTRFPRASEDEKERMIRDWKRKLGAARGVVRDFTRRVKDPNGLRLLDAGSGSGGLSIAFAEAGATTVGVDIEADLVEVARTFSTAMGFPPSFALYDAVTLPFPNDSFDGAVSVSVLEHTTSPLIYLKEIFRVLKPGGVLYLAFPNRLWPKETHTGLWGLTYLPRFLQDLAVRVFGKNPLADNNLHFYHYWNLKRLLAQVRVSATTHEFRMRPESGVSGNPFKVGVKAMLRAFGVPYQAFLPHIMLVLVKEKR